MCGGDRPGNELASRQQRRYGGVLAFELGVVAKRRGSLSTRRY